MGRKAIFGSLFAGVAMIAVGPALAQDAAASASATPSKPGVGPIAGNNQEIVVTAQKRSESLNTVPLSISAATGSTLQNLGVKSAGDLRLVTPGFVATTSIYGTPVYYLRGIGFSDVSLSARPAVSLYADEAPLPFSVMALGSTLDLERVEVLKGPQGTLFGSNSTGGAINFIAAKPTDHFTAGLDFSYGRFNSLDVNGFVSGPVGPNVRVRVAASQQYMGDWQYSYAGATKGETNGSKNITSGRIIVEADASERLKFSATLSGSKDRSDVQTPQLIGKNPPDLQPEFAAFPLAPDDARATSFSKTYPYGRTLQKDNWQWQGIFRADWQILDDVTATSLTSYVKNRQDYGQDADGTSLTINDLSVIGTLRSFTQELRLAGKFAGRGSWIVGANLEKDKTHEVTSYDISQARNGHVFDILGLPPIDLVPTRADTKINNKAVFANIDYPLTSRLTTHLGVRYTDARLDFAGCAVSAGNRTSPNGLSLILGIPDVPDGQCFSFDQQPDGTFAPILFQSKLNNHNISWRAGLDYRPFAGTMIYAQASRGYKAGTFSNIAAAFAAQYVPAKQERLTAYEVGVKSDVIPDLLHVNAALFYYDYRNKQVQGTIDTGPPFFFLQALVNIPKSRVQGFEVEGTLRPIHGLQLNASATYLDSKVRGSFIGNTIFGPLADFNGSAFPNTPKWEMSGRATYDFPITDSLVGHLGANLTYNGKSNGDFVADPRLAIKAYTLVDLSAGVGATDDSWRVEAWGRNVFNTFYYPTVTTFSEYIIRYMGMPATYGVTAKFKFR